MSYSWKEPVELIKSIGKSNRSDLTKSISSDSTFTEYPEVDPTHLFKSSSKNKGHKRKESYMAKQNLDHLSEYAKELHAMLHDEFPLDDWAEHKISICTAHLSDVKHYLQYKDKRGYLKKSWTETSSLLKSAKLKIEKNHMLKKNLYLIQESSRDLQNMISKDTPVMDWVAHKISVARTYLNDVKDSLEYRKRQGRRLK
tara:strand:+ start:1090 stop:1686 length:597 start_codon:yes stop_codon:yes gene_type:complete